MIGAKTTDNEKRTVVSSDASMSEGRGVRRTAPCLAIAASVARDRPSDRLIRPSVWRYVHCG